MSAARSMSLRALITTWSSVAAGSVMPQLPLGPHHERLPPGERRRWFAFCAPPWRQRVNQYDDVLFLSAAEHELNLDRDGTAGIADIAPNILAHSALRVRG